MLEDTKKELDYIFLIPTYNEALVIERTVRTLFNFLSNDWPNKNKKWKIIVADNASTDGTGKMVDSLKKSLGEKIDYFFIEKQGRGAAFKAALSKFNANIYFYTDADLPLEANDISSLLSPIEEGRVDITIGKRNGKRPLKRRMMTFVMRMINYLLFDLDFHDVQCGVKGFNGKAALILEKDCTEEGYFRDLEWIVKSKQHSLKVEEIPIHWIENRYSDRKSKIDLVKDSIKSLKATKKVFLQLYPSAWRDIIFLILTGIILVGLFVYQKLFLQLPNFSAINNPIVKSIENNIVWCDDGFLYFFILLYFLVAKFSSRKIPFKLYFAIILIIFILSAFVAIITHPIYSQDIYWNLLLSRGFTHYHLNPYVTTPNMLSQDSWSLPVRDWRQLSMTHGPLWALILLPVTFITSSLAAALIILKTIMFLALFGIFIGMLKIMDVLNFNPQKKIQVFLLLMLNPFVIESILVEGHNDVFMVLFIVLSLLFFLKGKYFKSAIWLVIGGLIKYVSIFLLPISLWYLIKKSDKPILKIIYFVLLTGAIGLIAYLPFISFSGNFRGIFSEVFTPHGRGIGAFSLGAVFLERIFPMSWGIIQVIGIFLGFIIMIFFLKNEEILKAYTLPFLIILLFTPWFMDWYGLWILPICALYASPAIIAFSSAMLFFNQISSPIYVTIFAIILILLFPLYRKIIFYL